MVRARNRLVRLSHLQDLLWLAAGRALEAGDMGRYRHFMERYESIRGGGGAD